MWWAFAAGALARLQYPSLARLIGPDQAVTSPGELTAVGVAAACAAAIGTVMVSRGQFRREQTGGAWVSRWFLVGVAAGPAAGLGAVAAQALWSDRLRASITGAWARACGARWSTRGFHG